MKVTLEQALQCSHSFNPISMKNYDSHGDDAYLRQCCTKCKHLIKVEYRLYRVTDQMGTKHPCDDIGKCCSKQKLDRISAVFDSGIEKIIEHVKCNNCSMQYILEFSFVEFYTDEDEDNGKKIFYQNGIVIKRSK